MKKAIFLAGLVGTATVAVSQSPTVETTKRGPSNDPNEVVCVREKEIGSRLAQRRVCRTRAQWEEFHAQTRQAVEKAQFDKPTRNN